MNSYEGVGKNIEAAIEDALAVLKVPREDVDIKVIEQGGFFKKAKVLVTISEDAKITKRKETKEEDISTEDILSEFKNSLKEVNKKEEPKKAAKKIITDEEISNSEEKENQEIKIQKEINKPVSPKLFIEGLLSVTGKEAKIEETKSEDGATVYKIYGDNLNELIGHRGECLYAISYLASSLSGRDERVRVDIEDYRIKREETLKALANRVASKVIKTGRYAKLEPMEAGERRIIHLALQDNEEVETLSKGNEPHRYIVIQKKQK